MATWSRGCRAENGGQALVIWAGHWGRRGDWMQVPLPCLWQACTIGPKTSSLETILSLDQNRGLIGVLGVFNLKLATTLPLSEPPVALL